MELRENIREGIRSIQGNLLRTILTAAIIAIGITALVGILTAIDGLKASIDTSFSSLGANTFDIKNLRTNRGSERGKAEKKFPKLKYDEIKDFKNRFEEGVVTLHTFLSGNTEVKRYSKKTNPNVNVEGVDENFMRIRDYNIVEGRNFTLNDIQYNTNYVIIGQEIVENLFEDNENPLDEWISLYGSQFKVIGVLEKKGGFGGSNWADRTVFMTLDNAIRLANRDLNYTITATINNPVDTEATIGEATGLMRRIRGDGPGEETSFEISRNQTVEEELEEISSKVRIGGMVIGIFTLLGASIGLMNIMLVSVTERTREIGVRKAIGATPRKIRQQFLIEAILICVMGGTGGVIFGLLIGNLVSVFLSSGQFVAPWQWVIAGLTVCVLVGIISGIYPAIKASKLDPIEALRYE